MVGSDDRVPPWAEQTRAALAGLAAGGLAAVRVCGGLMAVAGQDEPPEPLPEAAPCDPGELPPGYEAGWRMAAPLVAMPGYLSYLTGRLAAAGGRLLGPRRYATLAGVVAGTTARVIVNCPGAGARDLVPDPEVTAVRGQVVVVANPGITEFFVGHGAGPDEVTYVFPHGDAVVLGGTQEEGNWSRVPDPATARRILAATAAAVPRLAGAAVLEHRVGLRPARPYVRLEAQTVAGGRHVVHNYGHGGAGVSLSWGCAADAAALALAALGRAAGRP
jgi:D-amino-acid oxidase